MTSQLGAAGTSASGTLDGTRADLQQFTGETLPEVRELVAELRELTATLQRAGRQGGAQPERAALRPPSPRPGPGSDANGFLAVPTTISMNANDDIARVRMRGRGRRAGAGRGCSAAAPRCSRRPGRESQPARARRAPRCRRCASGTARPRAGGGRAAGLARIRHAADGLRERPYELDYFANNRWADAPARMLGPLLARALEQTGGFRAVVQAPTVAPADLRLVSELIRLQQRFRDAAEPRRTLVARATRRSSRQARAGHENVRADRNGTSDDAYGGVAAANIALERVLGEVAAFCVTEAGKVRKPGISAPMN